MEGTTTTAQIKSGISLKFTDTFSSSQYQLFEVDQELLERVTRTKEPLHIKSYQIGLNKTAALCSSGATYKLKKSENSNQMLVANLSQGTLLKQTTLLVDLEKSQTNIYQLTKLLSSQYSLKDSISAAKIAGISRFEILRQCQISEQELDTITQSNDKYKLYIFEYEPNMFVFFEPSLLYEITDSLLILMNAQMNQADFTLEEILSGNDGIINEKFSHSPKMIEYAMNDICCFDKDTGKYSLDQSKIVRSVALSLLTMKNSFHLKEFISALKHAIDLALPIDLQQLNMTEDSSFDLYMNLFEHYKDYDLSFLKGYAIIIPQRELRMVNKTDDVIRILDPFYSQEFEACFGSEEKRLEMLFEIKDKWTQSELQSYVKPFIDRGLNFDSFLLKNTRTLREKNPFDQSKDIIYFLKKF